AVPAVQVIATSRLFRAGVLLKSATALERLAEVDVVVFDKTGTLTEPTLGLAEQVIDAEALRVAASLAASSRHPLARSLLAATGPVPAAEGVVEHPGQGLSAGAIRLGSRSFCGDPRASAADGPELWLARPDCPPVRFAFDERLRPDARATVNRLRCMGLEVRMLSGDRAGSVARIAATLGITEWQAGCSPVEKVAAIEALAAAGRRVLMVGDGLNDGPSLAAAHVSASPASAADISQTVADVVFQGHKLEPAVLVLETARRARTTMRQNLALSIGYNILVVPLAIAGYVTPWLAAGAMSSSSLLVIGNSFRLRRGGQT
ncbi:MAG: HAD-IC family P-type ATPase, partial [Acetobacteraceae bacterium]|nr:HAD-IC family P-type ATPase [Acetobacteraceae bacterium]